MSRGFTPLPGPAAVPNLGAGAPDLPPFVKEQLQNTRDALQKAGKAAVPELEKLAQVQQTPEVLYNLMVARVLAEGAMPPPGMPWHYRQGSHAG